VPSAKQRIVATMPRPRLIVFAAIAVLACADPRSRPAVVPAAPTVILSIVGTNDLHGGILQRGDRGGLALLGGYVGNLRAARARDGGAVLLIDAGDMFQGTLESNLNEGASVIAAYNALGYAAAAVGNHDFDFGPVGVASTPQQPSDDARGALKARAVQAAFPFLAANLIDASTGRPVDWPNVRPSTMVTAGGIRVGIIGVMTERALSVTIAANVGGLQVAPLVETIAAEARQLRAAGAAIVVVTSHAGGRCTAFTSPADLSSCEPDEEIMRVARALPPGLVDAIVAGHAHSGMAHQVAGIAIIESFNGGRTFGRVDLVIDRATRRVLEKRIFAPRDLCARVDQGSTRCEPEGSSSGRVRAEYEGAPVAPAAAVIRAIAPAVQAAEGLKKTPLGVMLPAPIRRAGFPDSPLGNLFTDAYRARVPGADVSINNTSGGLRTDLPAGPLTYGAVFEVMPFDNRLVTFHLTGAELRTVFANQISRVPALTGVSGLHLRVTCERGAVNVGMLRPNGTPVTDTERLLVATTDFLATGGDAIFVPVTPPDGFTIEQDFGLVRDVVVESLKKRGGTLREDQLVDTANPRWVLPGKAPVTCR
jgi:2',3'-cyclic-nucleotide 2'-phosphodiesterase (5'-nucleotidase family)